MIVLLNKRHLFLPETLKFVLNCCIVGMMFCQIFNIKKIPAAFVNKGQEISKKQLFPDFCPKKGLH